MKLICTNCGSVMDKGTRLCSNIEQRCPPGTLSILFSPGDRVNDLEVMSEPHLFRASALYTARRDKEIFWLKVAHKDYEDRLKLEVALLSASENHRSLPTLVSASTKEHRPYGKYAVEGETKYYAIYQYKKGKFLREMLNQKQVFLPQQAAQLVILLSDAIAFLHVRLEKLLLNLSPDNIYLYIDKEDIPRPTLMDFALASRAGDVRAEWFQKEWKANYLAPEQVTGRPCVITTDVYALGLILYELLAGRPPFAAPSDAEVRSLVSSTKPLSLHQRRPDVGQGITSLVDQALEKNPSQRQADVRTFAKGLRTLVGEVPPEKLGWQIDMRYIAIAAFIALVVLVIFVLWLLTHA